MKRKILAFSALLLVSFSLGACSSKGIFGYYTLQMGKTRGTHFVITAELSNETSPYDANKKVFNFNYQSVNASSSSSLVSSTSEATSSVPTSSTSGAASSSIADSQSILASLFPINGAWSLATDNATIEMDIWISAEDIAETMSETEGSTSSSRSSSLLSGSALSNSSTASSSYASTSAATSSLTSSSSTPSGPLEIPYSFTKYFLKFKLNGKSNLTVTLPVSLSDAMTAIAAYFDGTPAEDVKINTVEIELTKE